VPGAHGYGRILASYHELARPVPWHELRVRFAELGHGGRADAVKIVAHASSLEDCAEMRVLAKSRTDGLDAIGAASERTGYRCTLRANGMRHLGGIRWSHCTAICMGEHGVLSRVTNAFFTPVTHPLLPTAAAPGQVREGAHSLGVLMHTDHRPCTVRRAPSAQRPVQELHRIRRMLGLLTPAEFCLFGKPVEQSMSPLLHNTGKGSNIQARAQRLLPLILGKNIVRSTAVAGFERLELPYRYTLCETDDVNVAVAKMADVWEAPPAMVEGTAADSNREFHSCVKGTVYVWRRVGHHPAKGGDCQALGQADGGGAGDWYNQTAYLGVHVFAANAAWHAMHASVPGTGAVNTVLQLDGVLYGDNTDWLGICETVRKQPRRDGRARKQLKRCARACFCKHKSSCDRS